MIMPTNKCAFIRYKHLDRFLSDHHHYYDSLKGDEEQILREQCSPLNDDRFLTIDCIRNYEMALYFILQNSRDVIRAKSDETANTELLDFIISKYELYNKLTEERANTLLKNIRFNEMYDNRVRGII